MIEVLIAGIATIGITVPICILIINTRKTIDKTGDVVEKVIDETGDTIKTTINKSGDVLVSITNKAGEVITNVFNYKDLKLDNKKIKQENENLYNKILKNTMEIEQLKARRIDVSGTTNIFKIGFIESEQSFTNFKQKSLSKKEFTKAVGVSLDWAPDWFKEKAGTIYIEEKEYIGIMETKYKQTFGIDIQKLQFQLIDHKILIYGLNEIVNMGIQVENSCRKIAEIRKKIIEKDKKELLSSAIQLEKQDLLKLQEEKDEQEKDVQEIINKNNYSKQVEKSIELMTMGFLQSVFHNSKYELEKANKPLSGNIFNFNETLEVINNNLNIQIEDKQKRIENNRLFLQQGE